MPQSYDDYLKEGAYRTYLGQQKIGNQLLSLKPLTFDEIYQRELTRLQQADALRLQKSRAASIESYNAYRRQPTPEQQAQRARDVYLEREAKAYEQRRLSRERAAQWQANQRAEVLKQRQVADATLQERYNHPSSAEPPATAKSARTAPAPVRSPVQIATAELPKPFKLGIKLPRSLPPAIPQAYKPARIGAIGSAVVDFPLRVISGQSTTQAAVGAAGTAAGTFAGGVVGALAGPFGMYVGGAIGGQIGGAIADWIYNLAAPSREKPEGVTKDNLSSPVQFRGGQSPGVEYALTFDAYHPAGFYGGTKSYSFIVKGPIKGVVEGPHIMGDNHQILVYATGRYGEPSPQITYYDIGAYNDPRPLEFRNFNVYRTYSQPDTGGNLVAPLPTDVRNPSTKQHPLAQPKTTSNGQAVVDSEAAAVPGGLKSYEGSSPRGDSPNWIPHAGLKGQPNPTTVSQNLKHDFPELQPQPGLQPGLQPDFAEPDSPQPLDIAPFLPPESDFLPPESEAPSTPGFIYKDPRYQTVDQLEQAKNSATKHLQDAIKYWEKTNPQHPAIAALEVSKTRTEAPYNKLIQDYQKRYRPSAEKIPIVPGSTGLPSAIEKQLIELGDVGSAAATLNALDPRFNTIRQLEESAANAVKPIEEAIKVWDRKLGKGNYKSQQLQQQRQAILEPFERQVREISTKLNLTSQDLETYEQAKRYLENRYNQPPLPKLTQRALEKNQAIPNPSSNSGKFSLDNPLAKTIPLIPALVRPSITPTGGRLTRPNPQPKAPDYNQPGTTCEFDPCLAGIQRKTQENSDKLDKLNAGLGAGNLAADLAGTRAILARLDKIDAKLGPQIPNGGIGGRLTSVWQSLNKLADWLHLDRILNLLTFITVVHNAYFLSNALTQTLFEMVSNGLAAVGIRNKEGDPLDINTIVGRSINNLFESLLGEPTVDGIKEAWKKYSRIYQAATNLLYSVTSILWSLQEVLEIIGENVNRIGNSLRKWGVVGEKAYGWMSEKMSKVGRFGRFEQAIQGVTEAADNVSEIAANVVDAQEMVAQLDNQKRDLQTAIASDTPKAQTENMPIKEEADRLKDFSQSPLITIDDEIKPEPDGTT